MEKDFRIGQSNELIKGSVLYDLHNLYDFSGCLLKSDRSFYLFFAPNPSHGAGHCPVAVEFLDVNFLGFSPNFGAGGLQDLEEMGYKSPSDLDDSWLLRVEQAATPDHLFFRFTGNAYIRIHSTLARIREGLTLPKTTDETAMS